MLNMLNTKTILIALAVLGTTGSGIIYHLDKQNKLAEESLKLQRGAAVEAQIQEQVTTNQRQKNRNLQRELVKSGLGQ